MPWLFGKHAGNPTTPYPRFSPGAIANQSFPQPERTPGINLPALQFANQMVTQPGGKPPNMPWPSAWDTMPFGLPMGLPLPPFIPSTGQPATNTGTVGAPGTPTILPPQFPPDWEPDKGAP